MISEELRRNEIGLFYSCKHTKDSIYLNMQTSGKAVFLFIAKAFVKFDFAPPPPLFPFLNRFW